MTWAAESWVSPLVRSHPAVDRVVSFPTMRGSHFSPDWIRRFVAAGRELRHERYDLALDLQGLFKSSVAAVLSRAPVRIGLGGRQREGARFVSRGIPFPAQRAHPVLENLACAEFLGASGDLVRFEVGGGAGCPAHGGPPARESRNRFRRSYPGGQPERRLRPQDLARGSLGSGLRKAWRIRGGSCSSAPPHSRRSTPSWPAGAPGSATSPERPAFRSWWRFWSAPPSTLPPTPAPSISPSRSDDQSWALYGPTSPDWIGPFGQRSHVLDGNERCGGTCPHTCLLMAALPSEARSRGAGFTRREGPVGERPTAIGWHPRFLRCSHSPPSSQILLTVGLRSIRRSESTKILYFEYLRSGVGAAESHVGVVEESGLVRVIAGRDREGYPDTTEPATPATAPAGPLREILLGPELPPPPGGGGAVSELNWGFVGRVRRGVGFLYRRPGRP